jgi:mycofactocin precursor
VNELDADMAVPATPDSATDDTTLGSPTDAADDGHVLAELLVEEVSIDGMCGVY